MDPYEQHKLRIADRTRDANYALWNGLLTLNGIVISVFSAVAVFSPIAKVLAVVIVAASMLSAGLLILNFRTTRNSYRLLGQMPIETVESLTAKQKEQQELNTADKAHHRCNCRETITLVILTIQCVLIFVLVFFKS